MRIQPIRPLHRPILGPLCCCLILWGCADSSISPAPKEIGAIAAKPRPARTPAQTGFDPAEIETLRTISVAPLSPDQGIDDRNIGKRVRWAGAVQYMEASDKGVCLTILYALSGEHGEPRWTPEPTYQTFKACATGSYDPELVRESTNVTIVGKISGKTYIGMGGGGSPGPIVEVEKLFRWSDCVAGDTSPVCKYGFLSPKTVPGD